jgi:hypothetical protein
MKVDRSVARSPRGLHECGCLRGRQKDAAQDVSLEVDGKLPELLIDERVVVERAHVGRRQLRRHEVKARR